MPSASLRGIEIAFDELGAGNDVLLLVHGHPFDRSMWKLQLDAVTRAGWRAIVPDLRGYGESTVVPGKTTLDVFADDLAALLDYRAIDRVVIGGLSMGGQVVMEFARRFPHRVRGVLLTATFPQAESEDGRRARNAMADRLLREGMDHYAEEVLPRMLAPESIRALPDVAAHVLGMMRHTDPRGAAAALRGRAERPSYETTLASLDVPTAIIVGSADAFTTPDDLARMGALVRGSVPVLLDGAGHMPNLERPDDFNSALLALLDRVRRMRVEPAAPGDLPAILAAYADARAIQRAQRSPVWAELTDDFLLAEIAEGRLLRVMDGDVLVGVFTAAYDDRVIWGERERGEHVYLHRIGRAAGYRGRGLLRAVLAWAWAKCHAMDRSGLRIDTWASNEALVALYARHGFQVVGERLIDHEPRLPAHYEGIRLTLLEAARQTPAPP